MEFCDRRCFVGEIEVGELMVVAGFRRPRLRGEASGDFRLLFCAIVRCSRGLRLAIGLVVVVNA